MRKGKKNQLISLLCFVAAAIIITALLPKLGKFQYEYQQGKQWQHEDLVTPFNFPILKTKKEYNDEVNRIKGNTKYFFKLDTTKKELTKNIFSSNIERGLTDLAKQKRYQKMLDNILANESLKNAYINDIKKRGNNIIDSLYKEGIIQENSNIVGRNQEYIIFLFIHENEYNERFLGDFFTMQSAVDFINHTQMPDDSLQKIILQSALIQSVRPSIAYDDKTTHKFQQNEIDNVVTTKGVVTAGETIIAQGEVVNEEKMSLLDSYKNYYNKERGGLTNNFLVIFGQFLFVALLLMFLYLFLLLFRKSVVASYKKTLSVLSLQVVAVLMVAIVSKIDGLSIYILPFTILPILIRSFYDTRLALFAHIIATILAAYFAPNNYEFLVLQLGAGMISIFSFVGFRKRSQLFVTIMAVLLTYSVLFTALTFMKNGSFSEQTLFMYLYFFISCFLTLLTFAFIFVFEKVFGLHSDFTLIELTDINSKLLKELSVKAPGTFQHSVQVANIAEAAIIEIGGNPLLIRAGALYHDIGKMEYPQYFIENQVSGINPHEKLTDEESARKIIHHVTYGVELARKNNLPEVIVHFIKTHHGTQKTKYFFRHFLQCNPHQKPDTSCFTYPGPIPDTKETAVLMMVDSVEAASRSMTDHTYEKLSNLVDKIIDGQLKENQYDHADITIRDMHKVKNVIKEKLVAIYHVRIEYPEEI